MTVRQSPPTAPAGAAHGDPPWRVPAICLVLAAITFAVFGQTLHHQFVNYDDDHYVYDNPVVEKGLTLAGARWALTYGKIGHWHPLTWLSHMLDCQLYGVNPAGHHLTNVLLHTAAAILLFLVLRRMTGALWRSAFVAAVFAIHPLRVESVAWISERKDVLSGVFFMLTLWSYVNYARQPGRWRFAGVVLLYGLGLLCKNTLVTLPFVLLLLDWWPLRRAMPGTSFARLVKEKIPLFLLSIGSCVATALVPEKVLAADRVPFLERAGNAVVSYGIYLWQMIWPAGLASPYPNPPNGQPFWKIALAFVVLAAISTIVLARRKKEPCLLVGWLWYLGMLVPAIGLVQISYYAHADRYTYLPEIGLALAGTWAVADWSKNWKHRQPVLGGLMGAVIGALMICAWIQTGYWKDSETWWTHTLACTTGNYVAQNDLGLTLVQKGSVDEAIAHFRKALEIRPAYVEAHDNIGLALFQMGKVDEAIAHYEKALQIKPDVADVHYNLGAALLQKGRMDEGIAQSQMALQIDPGYVKQLYNGGITFLQAGRVDEAIACFQEALKITPSEAKIHNNLGYALRQKGREDEALSHYQKALQIAPTDPRVQNNLAWLLATSPQTSLRNGDKALQLARKANEATGGATPTVLGTLAAAFAESGRFSEAVDTAQLAWHLAEVQSNTVMAEQLQTQLKLYQAGSPFHSPAQTH